MKQQVKHLSKIDGDSYKIRLSFEDIAKYLQKGADVAYYFDFWIRKATEPTDDEVLEVTFNLKEEGDQGLDPFERIMKDMLSPEEFKKLLK